MVQKLGGGFSLHLALCVNEPPSNRELRAWDGLSVCSHVLGLWLYAWLSACHVCWLPVQQLGSFRKKVRNPVSFEIAAGNIPLEPAGRDFVTWRCLLGQGHPQELAFRVGGHWLVPCSCSFACFGFGVTKGPTV